MKYLIAKKLQLQSLASAFQTLALYEAPHDSTDLDYWIQKEDRARQIAGRLQGIPHADLDRKKTTAADLQEFAALALTIRENTTDQEGQEYWQNTHQLCSDLADEITDLIPTETPPQKTAQAVY